MNPRFQRRVQRYGWDRAASCYERFWGRQIRPAQETLIAMARLQPGQRVLDVACGTGMVTYPAAEIVGRSGAVFGADLSEAMVESMLEGAVERGLESVVGRRMDSEALRLDDRTFDVALNSLGLMYAPDPVAAVREMWRVLRPGGRAAAAVWGARRNCGWAEIFPIVDARVASEVCPLFFGLGEGDGLEASFRQAGFDRIECRRISVSLPYDSDAEALGAAFAGGPVALAYSKFTPDVREEAHREYLRSIGAHSDGSGGYAIPGEFVIVTGRRPNDH